MYINIIYLYRDRKTIFSEWSRKERVYFCKIPIRVKFRENLIKKKYTRFASGRGCKAEKKRTQIYLPASYQLVSLRSLMYTSVDSRD